MSKTKQPAKQIRTPNQLKRLIGRTIQQIETGEIRRGVRNKGATIASLSRVWLDAHQASQVKKETAKRKKEIAKLDKKVERLLEGMKGKRL